MALSVYHGVAALVCRCPRCLRFRVATILSEDFMTRSFAITYDYLCPFARIANEAIVDALARRCRLGRQLPPVLARPKSRRGG